MKNISEMCYPYRLPALPYAYDALEPVIDSETLHYHHDKHFATYVQNLNAALEGHPGLQRKTLAELLSNPDCIPEDIRTKVVNNGGGVYNHALYFAQFNPEGGCPRGRLLAMIEKTFGSFADFKTVFSAKATAVFGSGYTVLALTKRGELEIVNVKNQDTVLPMGARTLILFDVWEHAYYLKYKNLRAEYVEKLWDIVDFPNLCGC